METRTFDSLDTAVFGPGEWLVHQTNCRTFRKVAGFAKEVFRVYRYDVQTG